MILINCITLIFLMQGTLDQAESLGLPMKVFAKHSHEGNANTWTYLQDELFIQLHPELKEHLGNPVSNIFYK